MIKLFTGQTCTACTALKGRLIKMGLTDYVECDISDDTHKDSILALGFRSIPVLVKYGPTDNVVATIGGNLHTDAEYIELFKGNMK
jgi:hypothetical protein|tara:strand:- start:904 stop:1161 length:258 start_codon:yes stop_codon:yes gene_type:complete